MCYRCLLGDSESQTLAQLRDLTRRRRIMHFLLQNDPKTAGDITAVTGMASVELARHGN